MTGSSPKPRAGLIGLLAIAELLWRSRRLLVVAIEVGVCFGYAVLVHTPVLAIAGVPASAVGAALVAMISGWLSRVKNEVEGPLAPYRKKH